MELIIGALVSLVVQAIKGKQTPFATLSILAVLCLAASGFYTALVAVGYWETVYQVIITAGAFYAFVIQRFEGTELFTPEELER